MGDVDTEPPQPNGWMAPIALTTDRLACAWCDWSAPRLYRNQSDTATAEPRSGMTRLYGHAKDKHPYALLHAFKRAKRDGERDARPYLRGTS